MSAGETYPSANALMEANNRKSENIDAITLLTSSTSNDRDTYSNLSGTVTSLMSEIVISNKNLVEALKEKTRLERSLGQCQQRASTTGSGGATWRGGNY